LFGIPFFYRHPAPKGARFGDKAFDTSSCKTAPEDPDVDSTLEPDYAERLRRSQMLIGLMETQRFKRPAGARCKGMVHVHMFASSMDDLARNLFIAPPQTSSSQLSVGANLLIRAATPQYRSPVGNWKH